MNKKAVGWFVFLIFVFLVAIYFLMRAAPFVPIEKTVPEIGPSPVVTNDPNCPDIAGCKG